MYPGIHLRKLVLEYIKDAVYLQASQHPGWQESVWPWSLKSISQPTKYELQKSCIFAPQTKWENPWENAYAGREVVISFVVEQRFTWQQISSCHTNNRVFRTTKYSKVEKQLLVVRLPGRLKHYSNLLSCLENIIFDLNSTTPVSSPHPHWRLLLRLK